MEGKVIKEESVGSPCSPVAASGNIPSGKENRRVGSPLNTSEILTRSRTKVLSKENCHSHHGMSESPKAAGGSGGSQTPPISGVKSNSSHHSHGHSHSHIGSHSHSFGHQFSSPHSTTSISNGAGGVSNRASPSPPPINGSSANNNSNGNNNSGSSARTPSSSSNSSGSLSGSSNGMGHGGNSSRHIVKIKRFLGTLLHFGCDISPEVGDRVRTLVFNLVSGHLSIEEFHHSLQEVTSFPLRPFVLPFLRAHLPLLQREISHLARIAKQTALSYVRSHEQVILEAGSSPGEPCDIFHSEAADLGLPTKRKAPESFYDNGEGGDGTYTSTPKRHHASLFSPPFFISASGSSSSASISTSEFREFYSSPYPMVSSHHGQHSHSHHEPAGSQSTTPSNGGSGCGSKGPEDEWRNIHVMLNCILSMVEKTKRALGILQNRTSTTTSSNSSGFHSENDISTGGGGGGGQGGGNSPWLSRRTPYSAVVENSEDFKRQAGEMMAQALRATEDRVAEVKRRAEEAVQEVKRQALVELQRAVAAAEARACEAVASERARLERVLIDSRRVPTESVIVGNVDAETCWNCGRKAHETCSGCNMAKYCSAFCQHKDWENHHTVCGRNSSCSSAERGSAGGGATGAGTETKSSQHAVHENSNSSPINVSNPSPDNHSSGSNN